MGFGRERPAGRLVSAALEANVRRADNRRHPADLASRESSFAICLTYSSVNCAFAFTIEFFGGELAFWLIVITPFIWINNVMLSLRLGLTIGRTAKI
jgi:hypothetical protein